MFVSMVEVAVFALVAFYLFVPLLRGAVRQVRPAPTRASGTARAEPCAAPDTGSVIRDQQPPDAAGAREGDRPVAEGGEVRRRWAGRIGGALFLIAIMNFLAYSAHTRNLGGSADSSKGVEGRYFVSAHGRYTEVTEDQWRAVRAHELVMYVTHALGLLVGGALLAYSERRPGQAEAEPGAAPGPARTFDSGSS
jgi:hypothetical protein